LQLRAHGKPTRAAAAFATSRRLQNPPNHEEKNVCSA
jgi:hypothetical protein